MRTIKQVVLIGYLSAATGTACAQSTVSLYGLIDTSLRYLHNSGGQSTQVSMVSGGISGSRWGLKGAEELGGGLKAVFQLENGFNSTNGKLKQGGREFGRQAFVGISSSTFGRMTLGRQYDPLSDMIQPLQSNGYLGGFFSAPGDIDNADNSIRVSNAIKWSSPSWGPVKITALYGVGGVAGAAASGQTYGAAAAYNSGPFGLAAGFEHINNGNARLSSRGTSSADSLFGSSVNAAYATASSIDIVRAAGNYVIGSMTLGAYYSFSDYKSDADSLFVGSEKYHNVSVYGVWQISPALAMQMGYDYLRAIGESSARYHQGTAGVGYSLSKRTDLYGIVAYTHASGQNGAGPAQAVVGSVNVDAGKSSQVLATVGLRHRF
ncbi:TPA: porin [Burkholderia cenocepacia]|nr:porin [Burkholderia cenocepacia]